MIRLGASIPNIVDATSWYRAAGPLADLEVRSSVAGHHFSVEFGLERYSWPEFRRMTGLFMQRPYRPSDLAILKIAKSQGIPVWIDWDDNPFSIPEDNPAYFTYMEEKTQFRIAEILSMADIVSVSTLQLKRQFQKKLSTGSRMCKYVVVIPNSVDYRSVPIAPLDTPREKTVFWRGTNTHQQDLMSVAKEIVETAKANPTWNWTFLGYIPWFIVKALPKGKVTCIQSVAIDLMQQFINEQARPAIMMVPLELGSKFTICKSNIAWIEGTMGGAAVLAPNMEEWAHPGVTLYSSPGDFSSKLGKLMADYETKPEILKEKVRISRKVIDEQFNLQTVNKAREEIIVWMDDITRKRKQGHRGDFPPFRKEWLPLDENEAVMHLN